MFRADSSRNGLERGAVEQQLQRPEDRGQHGNYVELRKVAVRDSQLGNVIEGACYWRRARGRGW
jgi:hypothetical protein